MGGVTAMYIEPTLIINGEVRATAARAEVTNPATGATFATVAVATLADLDDAFASAQAAQPGWAALPFAQRVAILERVAECVAAHGEELAQILTREQGKPLKDARTEVATVGKWIGWLSLLTIDSEMLESDERRVVELRREPIGVVAAITPWNVPLGLAAWKFVPALLAGNTMVLKPSPFTPVATARLAELVRTILPAGVLTVVTGGDDLGAAMTRHPIPGKVTMTGSIATGRKVAAAAADGLKRVTLELGGNDPAIVLADVDVDEVAMRLFSAAFVNNGQICTAVKRVYVHESIASELASRLATLAADAVVGDGLTEGVRFGPLATADQRDRVESLVQDAVAAGATIETGGRRVPGAGFFYEPTIVTDIPHGTALELEEQFGPALPVLTFTEVDDVIARVNDGPYGLGASVWSSDIDAASAVAAQLDAGTVWINAHMALSPLLPFGGHKHSGLGVENGVLGLHEYTQVRVLHRPVG